MVVAEVGRLGRTDAEPEAEAWADSFILQALDPFFFALSSFEKILKAESKNV